MYTEKEKVRVVMCTSLYKVEGDIYIIPGSRITDMLNVKAHDFFPFTNAKVMNALDDKVLFTKDYLTVHRNAILVAFPAGDG
ncbi:MAG: hypothetical protein QMD53_03525 [Actinomycetota bacterium]|nr:hypothetical protein [Actinomycetota bacterium]